MHRMLCDKKGESLIESVISILVFSIFMIGISGMILTSVKVNAKYNVRATEMQKEANQAILEEIEYESTSVSFTISGTGIDDVVIDVYPSEENGFQAFVPEPGV